MAVELLTVGEHLSLEFGTADLDDIRAYIREQYVDHKSTPSGIATIVHFGGEDFTFQNEWDDPCLISSSDAGDALLRKLYTTLNGA